MSASSSFRKMNAMHWSRLLPTDRGNPTFRAPVPIKVLWFDCIMQYLDETGESRTARASVHIPKGVFVGDVIRLVDDDSCPCDCPAVDDSVPCDPLSPVDPFIYKDAYEIHRIDTTPVTRTDKIRIALL